MRTFRAVATILALAGIAAIFVRPRRNRGTGPELASLTREELYRMAQERGIPGRSRMSKESLIAVLRELE